MKSHEKFIKKCLELAKLGKGKTKSNPLVGCVIVYKGKIISEGYHEKYGEHHAEVNAIQNTKKKELLAQSTLYVNLEPCCHFGKTPPCVNLILKYNIKSVVIGTKDPNINVNGRGIEQLSKKIKVTTGVLERECIELNKKYFINHSLQRPIIILKWAESQDEFINTNNTGITKISCRKSHVLSHKWRSKIDAIMVGTNTVMFDNPKLTTRETKGKNPIRITIDRNNRLSLKRWNILNNESTTIIFHNKQNIIKDNNEYINMDHNLNDNEVLFFIIKHLYQKGIKSILIEGGQKLLQNFINIDLWDEMRIFKATMKLHQGIKAPTIKKAKDVNKQIQQIGIDTLTTIYNNKIIKSIEQSF